MLILICLHFIYSFSHLYYKINKSYWCVLDSKCLRSVLLNEYWVKINKKKYALHCCYKTFFNFIHALPRTDFCQLSSYCIIVKILKEDWLLSTKFPADKMCFPKGSRILHKGPTYRRWLVVYWLIWTCLSFLSLHKRLLKTDSQRASSYTELLLGENACLLSEHQNILEWSGVTDLSHNLRKTKFLSVLERQFSAPCTCPWPTPRRRSDLLKRNGTSLSHLKGSV